MIPFIGTHALVVEAEEEAKPRDPSRRQWWKCSDCGCRFSSCDEIFECEDHGEPTPTITGGMPFRVWRRKLRRRLGR